MMVGMQVFFANENIYLFIENNSSPPVPLNIFSKGIGVVLSKDLKKTNILSMSVLYKIISAVCMFIGNHNCIASTTSSCIV